MTNIFAEIAKPFVWIGKELGKAVTYLPKLLKAINDGKVDGEALVADLGEMVDDAAEVSTAAVKDGGVDITALETLLVAIIAALADKGVNITEDEAVYSAFKAFVANVKATNLTDLLAAVKKLVATSAQFGTTAKAALAQLEADIK